MASSQPSFVNGVLPLELEMRVEEEQEDEPEEVEAKPAVCDTNYTEEGSQLPTTSLGRTAFHEEIDIKEETSNNEEELQRPFAVHIKEEQIYEDEEEEEEKEDDASTEAYESYNKDEHDTEVNPPLSFNRALVEGGEDGCEEEILPHSSVVVIKGKDGRPLNYLNDNIKKAANLPYLVQQQKNSGKRVDTVFRCPNCSLCYTSAQYLTGHVRRGCRYRPSPIKNAYTCIECGEGFNNYGSLFQHKRQKHDAVSNSVVGEPVLSIQSKVVKDKGSSSRKYPCSNCPRSFTAPGYLLQHQRAHLRSQTDHSCDICGEDFEEKSIEEMEKHFSDRHPTKERQRCKDCCRVYGHHMSLLIHLETHEERMCRICFKKFRNQRLLALHQRTHTNDQNYQCKVCGKFFVQLGRFMEHRRRVHSITAAPPGLGSHENESEEDEDDPDPDISSESSLNTSETLIKRTLGNKAKSEPTDEFEDDDDEIIEIPAKRALANSEKISGVQIKEESSESW